AINGLPAPIGGELTFTLSDSQCGWNNGTYLIQADSGKLSITTTKRAAKIEMAIQGLSALVYGTNAIDEIEYQGWIKGLDSQRRKLLQNWFPPIYLYNPYNF
ncbi:MAG: sterol carrier protein domain-containing protein, partial [Candidatus Thorarchaeota archaeon]